jgi:hypothetical protein
VGFLRSAYVFIDGNNLYHNLRSSGIKPGDISLAKLSCYVSDHFNASCLRSIYYNSMPSIELGKEKYFRHMEFIAEAKER